MPCFQLNKVLFPLKNGIMINILEIIVVKQYNIIQKKIISKFQKNGVYILKDMKMSQIIKMKMDKHML